MIRENRLKSRQHVFGSINTNTEVLEIESDVECTDHTESTEMTDAGQKNKLLSATIESLKSRLPVYPPSCYSDTISKFVSFQVLYVTFI